MLSEHVYGVSEEKSRDLLIGQIAHPVNYVNALHEDDSLFDAFTRFERLGRDYLLVLDERENFAGIITREQMAGYL